jgi:signal transduction histidine kinase
MVKVENGGVIARLSLEYKLPLIIGGLLLVVIVALTSAAYLEVRGTSEGIATERLTNVTLQFRDLLQQSGAQLRTQAAAAASKPGLVEFAKTHSVRARDRAVADLKYIGPQAEQVVATELRDSAGTVLLTTASAGRGLDTMSLGDVLPRTEPGDSAVIGAFRLLHDTLVYPVATPVQGASNAYVVRWRRIAGTRRSREQLTRLIGNGAQLFLGNVGGKHWTNFEGVVPAPPLNASASEMIQTYKRDPDRREYLAAATRIPGTPWLVAIDFPMRSVRAPVNSFVEKIELIALAALALGLVAAWLMSRRITDPLRQLTLAADEIAAGKHEHPVHIQRSDELGRLGKAFTTMAGEVRVAREGLERKVEERTSALNQTLHQLYEAQESLVRKEKLAMLGQLASGVGHELRNPLGVMTNAVYFLKMVLSSSPQKTVLEYLDILQQQITLSEKIVSDLLDFARSKPPQRLPTDVANLTRAQLDRLGATNGIRVETNVPRDLPPVLVDPTQMGQIVLNLLTNAVQAIEGSGSIAINAHANGGAVHLDVTDTGPGVPPENIEKIFEPLFTTKARGIGLGLAVSRTLARANGGDLTVRSMMGQGATFRLTLPVATEENK